MSRHISLTLALIGVSVPSFAQDTTWRTNVKPIVETRCIDCHGADAPEYNDWELLGEAKTQVSPRMDTYPHFMSYVVWPATGAMMRRLDDGKNGGKPGNMYQHLGENDGERSKNLTTIKKWLGEGAWNLNRWQGRNEVPGISKEQLEKIKAKY